MWQQIIEILFPLHKDVRLARSVTSASAVEKLNPKEVYGVIALTSFKDLEIRACIHAVKYYNDRHARGVLAIIVGEWLKTYRHDAMLIPIPLSGARQRERGYNQVTEVVKEALYDMPAIELSQDILTRVRDTTPQTKLSREERLKNVTDAFSIRDTKSATEKISGKHIILLDDVVTTGATLKAARAVLAPHRPASITCVAMAH